MNWFDLNTLQTVGSAAACITIVTGVAKSVFGISGRVTQLVALGLSAVIAGVLGDLSSPTGLLLTLLNACVLCATAIGINEGITYRK